MITLLLRLAYFSETGLRASDSLSLSLLKERIFSEAIFIRRFIPSGEVIVSQIRV